MSSRPNPTRVTDVQIGSPPEEPDDQQLITLIAGGDGAAFGRLAVRLGRRLRAVLFRLGLSEPEQEDALQESLVAIWRGAATFRGSSSVATWATRIAINQGLSVIRRRRETALPEPLITERGASITVEETWERQAVGQQVRMAVLSLPEQLRVVVVLREYEDLSYKSIAEVLDVPIGTVMSRLHKARSHLRRELAGAADQI